MENSNNNSSTTGIFIPSEIIVKELDTIKDMLTLVITTFGPALVGSIMAGNANTIAYGQQSAAEHTARLKQIEAETAHTQQRMQIEREEAERRAKQK